MKGYPRSLCLFRNAMDAYVPESVSCEYFYSFSRFRFSTISSCDRAVMMTCYRSPIARSSHPSARCCRHTLADTAYRSTAERAAATRLWRVLSGGRHISVLHDHSIWVEALEKQEGLHRNEFNNPCDETFSVVHARCGCHGTVAARRHTGKQRPKHIPTQCPILHYNGSPNHAPHYII